MGQFQKVLVFLFMIFGLDSAQEAHAYLDPASGGLILQLLLGGIGGVLVIFKLYWQQFIGIFRTTQTGASSSTSSGDNSPKN